VDINGTIWLLLIVLLPIGTALARWLSDRQGKKAWNRFAVISSAAVLAALLVILILGGSEPDMYFRWNGVCGLGIYLKADGFRLIFGIITAFVWLMASVYSSEYFIPDAGSGRYFFFYQITFGASLGVFLSADLFTAFIFFEMMSLASYVMVIHEETETVMKAGTIYLAVAVIGGMAALMGGLMLYHQTGTLVIDELTGLIGTVADKGWIYTAGGLILAGYGAKAGMFPLHFWLPDTYSAAPVPAAAILSAVLSKVGVFGILAIGANVFLYDQLWGYVLLPPALLTMLVGGARAVCSNNLKYILACSSMSQMGFILFGCAMQNILGAHNALAVRGTLLHMINHSLIKLILFLTIGVVFMNLETWNLNEVRGFGRKKPLLFFSFLMAYLGIIGIPLWNGYVSKTLLHESLVEYAAIAAESGTGAVYFQAAEWLFILASGLTAAYMTKVFAALFLEKAPAEQAGMAAKGSSYMQPMTAAAIVLPAVLLPVMGFAPNIVMDSLAGLGQGFMHGHDPEHAVHYFSWVNVKGTLVSLFCGTVIYFAVVRKLMMKREESGVKVYRNVWPVWLNLETLFWRPVVRLIVFICTFMSRLLNAVPKRVIHFLAWVLKPHKPEKYFRVEEKSEDPEDAASITRSLSFSLLLFGMGACTVLIYLIVRVWQ